MVLKQCLYGFTIKSIGNMSQRLKIYRSLGTAERLIGEILNHGITVVLET